MKQKSRRRQKNNLLARRQLFAAYCGIHYAGAETPSTPHVMSKCFKAFTPHQLGDEICRKERNLTEVCSEQRFTTSVLFPSHSYSDTRSQGVMDLSEYLIADSGKAFLSLGKRMIEVQCFLNLQSLSEDWSLKKILIDNLLVNFNGRPCQLKCLVAEVKQRRSICFTQEHSTLVLNTCQNLGNCVHRQYINEVYMGCI